MQRHRAEHKARILRLTCTFEALEALEAPEALEALEAPLFSPHTDTGELFLLSISSS